MGLLGKSYLKFEKVNEAIEQFENALKIDAKDFQSYNYRAVIHIEHGSKLNIE